MANIDYKKLYKLQDSVLDIIFSVQPIFYLTGGTCLSRFYKEKRYSDDLDLFTHESDKFFKVVKEIKLLLLKHFQVNEEVSSKDFVRLNINNILQVDFVNDKVIRYKETITLDNGYIIDNYENIFANKITAVMGRDNPKDIFDIYLIMKFFKYNLKDILEVAHQKAFFYNDDLIIRLKSFPTFLLTKIKLVDKNFLDNFELEYNKIIEKIEENIY